MSKKETKSMNFGVEFELFTLDSKGKMFSGAPKLIQAARKKFPSIDLAKECGKNMVELRCPPQKNIALVFSKMIDDLQKVNEIANNQGMHLFMNGCYPGSFVPEMNSDKGYRIKEQIFGKQRFSIAARCIGFHCHYSLPFGVFDYATKMIKNLVYSKNKQNMVDMYNLFIAMDPALATFTQSSPYYQGSFIGKDSRMIVYRGGKTLLYPKGLYANYQDFGALQQYKATGFDILERINYRFDRWTNDIKSIDVNLKTFLKHGSMLDTAWNPVKISGHGTLEQRGMDSNHPSILLAVSVLMEHITREVQGPINVVPSDIGIVNPFKKEKNVVYIPPHTHVRFNLQVKAAYEGLVSDEVFKYCQGLLKLAKQCIPKNQLDLINPLEKMLKERKTTSDSILEDAKRIGADKTISNKQAAELALRHCGDLERDMIKTKYVLSRIV